MPHLSMNKLFNLLIPAGGIASLIAGGIFVAHFVKAVDGYVVNGNVYNTLEEALPNVSPSERGTVKGVEIAKIGTIAKMQRGDYSVEVVSMEPREGGVEIYVKAWDANNNPIGFGRDGTVETERFVIINPPVLVYDPNGPIVRTYTNNETGVTTEKHFREDLQESVLLAIEASIKSHSTGNVISGKVGRSTLIAYPNAGSGTAPMDGDSRPGTVGASFSTKRNEAAAVFNTDGQNTTGYATVRVRTTAITDEFQTFFRGGWGWDTSSIPDGAVISSSTVGFIGTEVGTDLGDTDVQIVSLATPANETAMVAADFDPADFGATVFASASVSGINVAGTSNDNNLFTLNANGIAAINKTGNTYFGARIKWDTDNSFTGTWASSVFTSVGFGLAEQTGTNLDPKLTVEYTLDPPVLSNLSASNVTSDSALITWTTDISSDSEVTYDTSSPVTDGDPSVYDGTATTTHSVTLSGLTGNVTYYFFASSTASNGLTGTSTESSFMTSVVDIEGLHADNIGAGWADIKWTTVSSATSKVWYSLTSPVSATNFTEVASTTTATDHTLTLEGLLHNAIYYYVAVSGIDGNFATSSERMFNTTSTALCTD